MRWRTSECGDRTYRVCQQNHETEAQLCSKACVLMALERLLGNEGNELPFDLAKNASVLAISEGLARSASLGRALTQRWGTFADLAEHFGAEREKVYILTYRGPKGGHYVVAEYGAQGGLVVCDPWDGKAHLTNNPRAYHGGASKGVLAPEGILEISRKE